MAAPLVAAWANMTMALAPVRNAPQVLISLLQASREHHAHNAAAATMQPQQDHRAALHALLERGERLAGFAVVIGSPRRAFPLSSF